MRQQTHDATAETAEAARHVRMLTTLMAGCDPCGWVDGGGSPNLYAGVALDVLSALRRGADLPAVLMLFPGEASVEQATRFTRVALDWWRTAQEVRMASAPARHRSA